MKHRITTVVGLWLLTLVPRARAQEEDLSKLPGYVDFSIFNLPEEQANVEVYLTESLLSLIGPATEDDTLLSFLSKLKLIRVQTYELGRLQREEVRKKAGELAQKLEQQKWEKAVRVRERDEDVYVYLKSAGKKFTGLVVMTIDQKGEAAFVNIVGEINPKELGKLSRRFNLPKLDSLEVAPKESPKRKP